MFWGRQAASSAYDTAHAKAQTIRQRMCRSRAFSRSGTRSGRIFEICRGVGRRRTVRDIGHSPGRDDDGRGRRSGEAGAALGAASPPAVAVTALLDW